MLGADLMNLSKKDSIIYVGGGMVISLIIFAITYFIKPSIISNKLFYIPVGLLPMIILVGKRLNKLEKEEKNKKNEW